MSDYTPTTAEIRKNYWIGTAFSKDAMRTADKIMEYEAFDRWLAEVKADAWEEGMYAGKADDYFGDPDNPYRQGVDQ